MIDFVRSGGRTMLARTGMMQALIAGTPQTPPSPRRKRAETYRMVR